MLLLYIGILSSLQSCKIEKSYLEIYNHKYINNSNFDIHIKVYQGEQKYVYNYDLLKDSILLQESYGEVTGFISYADSIIITYGDNKQYKFNTFDTSDRNLMNYENYSEKKLSKYHYEYSYIFTDEDYNQADDLN